jgi:hypothetical protein
MEGRVPSPGGDEGCAAWGHAAFNGSGQFPDASARDWELGTGD